jgi:hypothetical protein
MELERMLLFVGDDWAEEHHDVELQDAGRLLGRAKLPEGVAGIARLHAMIGEHLGEGVDEADVVVGIEIGKICNESYQVYGRQDPARSCTARAGVGTLRAEGLVGGGSRARVVIAHPLWRVLPARRR